MDHITGPSIVKLMKQHDKTIRVIAASLGVSMNRVRQVRAHGVHGTGYVQDWMQAITGDYKSGWDVVARAYV